MLYCIGRFFNSSQLLELGSVPFALPMFGRRKERSASTSTFTIPSASRQQPELISSQSAASNPFSGRAAITNYGSYPAQSAGMS